jgi:Tfp pilus assembly protein PilO
MPLPSFHHPILKKAYKQFSPIVNSKKTASYFTITLSLLSLSFFGIFAIRPTIITATTLIKSVSDLKKLSIQYEEKIGNLVRGQSEYEQIRKQVPLIESALPADSQFSKLAKAVEKFALKENISFSQFQIDSVPISMLPPVNKLYSYGFSMSGYGEYSSISLFISHLINWKRLITINNIELSQEGSTQSGQLRLSLKGTAYYEP